MSQIYTGAHIDSESVTVSQVHTDGGRLPSPEESSSDAPAHAAASAEDPHHHGVWITGEQRDASWTALTTPVPLHIPGDTLLYYLSNTKSISSVFISVERTAENIKYALVTHLQHRLLWSNIKQLTLYKQLNKLWLGLMIRKQTKTLFWIKNISADYSSTFGFRLIIIWA